MPRIATLTMNPTIDVSYDVARMQHTHKMRTQNEQYAPGGGGINVARVFHRLGGEALSFYLSGGETGPALDGLLADHGLGCCRIPIKGATRIASAVHELDTGKEYRFTPSGPTIEPAEWQACLDAMEAALPLDALVLSGSLPQGVPPDFYARAARLAQARGTPVVLDTSGEALAAGLEVGGLLLVKPSQGELAALVGRSLQTIDEIGAEASRLVDAGKAQLVAVTLGHLGAVLAQAGGTTFLPAPQIEAKSAVGAGDSFVAAMVHALTSGRDVQHAFCLGMAAGSAAVLSPGTGLAHPDDIARLHAQICGC
ncbi:6-phosphofructokinase 2 [Novosphingobium chloroacetimidivorans]|uniref:Phosphofructokinase n=1 Tax=Novosphingobium chloroacetimidivorans TaxID=1428314 RepID=A0A7W7K928_9SPHN|nr:1-phosphofructokinase family hexose kinase [Novosphingobium chloroacetimidivorans]MBB4858494.1 6-phosphofructokinase 2 [Novosphingobium chloroacetimidivorans]